MIEIRIHGRGGQGNVVAAYLLASAAINEGRHGQAFPAFGAERRGAPVVAFVRVADQPFRRRSQVLHPQFLIIQDQALLHVPGVLDGLAPGGAVLINSTLGSEALSQQLGRPAVALPATGLAMEYLKRPVPNTALLAAFLALTRMLPVAALVTALSHKFKGEVLDRNARLVEAAAQCVVAGAWQKAADATGA